MKHTERTVISLVTVEAVVAVVLLVLVYFRPDIAAPLIVATIWTGAILAILIIGLWEMAMDGTDSRS